MRVSAISGHRFRQFADSDFSNSGTEIPLNRGQLREVGFRERRSGNVVSQAEFERGNAETEASETNHCEGPTIDPEADVRARPVGAGDLGTAADQHDLGRDLSAAGARSGLKLAVAADLRERGGVTAGLVPAGRATAAGLERA